MCCQHLGQISDHYDNTYLEICEKKSGYDWGTSLVVTTVLADSRPARFSVASASWALAAADLHHQHLLSISKPTVEVLKEETLASSQKF